MVLLFEGNFYHLARDCHNHNFRFFASANKFQYGGLASSGLDQATRPKQAIKGRVKGTTQEQQYRRGLKHMLTPQLIPSICSGILPGVYRPYVTFISESADKVGEKFVGRSTIGILPHILMLISVGSHYVFLSSGRIDGVLGPNKGSAGSPEVRGTRKPFLNQYEIWDAFRHNLPPFRGWSPPPYLLF